jgi:transposase
MDEFAAFSREDLVALILEQRQTILHLQQRVAALEAKLEDKSSPGAPPPFVRANVKRKQEKQERKKRTQAFVRPREAPTQVCLHAASQCPDCGRALSGGSEHRRRQVIEIPQTPVQVTDHVVLARWCGVCQKRVLPKLDLSSEVVGQHRVGVRLMSLIGWLHTVGRLPLRTVQSLLLAVYGLHLGRGELSEILHTLAARGKTEYQRLQEQVRGSPFVHADETGWREDGQSGYLWSFSTPTVRFYHYNQSRAGAVPVSILGEAFAGITVSDFYGGYNGVGTVRQRCWVHFLRDLHALTQAHPQNEAVQAWARAVRAVYDGARAWQSEARAAVARHGQAVGNFGFGVFARRAKRKALEEQLYGLALPHLEQEPLDPPVPQRVLCQRIASFLPELFVFVEHVEVPSENNAAERSVRGAVIARKISGGTRSASGSTTKMTLLSLFGTWQAQGREGLEACRQMLVQPALPSAPATAA